MCIACQTELNPDALEAFGERFVNLLNESATAVMVSLGHRTRLFDVMAGLSPSSSQQIADAAGLNERYVREWLAAMVCAKIIEVDDSGLLFSLPATHAALLAREGEGDCLAHLSRYITTIASVEEQILECFRNGGGVPYSAFPGFHDIMEEDSTQSVINVLHSHIIPLVDGLEEKLEKGIDVIDIGCGRARAILELAGKYPKSGFTGLDLSQSAIEYGNEIARAKGLNNISLHVRDLSDFDEMAVENSADLILSFDAIHDQARPDRVLVGIRRTMRPDGVYIMQDIGASSNVFENQDHPIGPLLYSLSCCHCMTVSLAQGGLGVGAMWGEQLARKFLSNAGFTRIDKKLLEHDIQNYYYICR
ncbi:MAG: class I SAM-dependent methyltransferase [Puniceicoccales bacterium]